jgi:xanthine/CO dehydrogenase XdhC/CoxF family maturation factor
LAVNDRGTMVGSVSAGCVEGAVIEEAKKVIASGTPKLMEFGVTDDQAWEVGLSCGGEMHVFVEPLK